jgi:hypothetical protein
METCRYIDFPGVGVIDLKAPQLPEKVYEVAAERMFNEPTIMETIASISKAMQEYERVGGFAPAVAADTEDVALAAPAAHVEPIADVFLPPQVDEGQEASPPQSIEATEAPAPIAKPGMAEAVVRGERTSPPRPVAAEARGVETHVLDEPATIVQESVIPETMTRTASPEIQEAEETGRPCHMAQWAERPRPLSSRALHGRLPPVLTPTPRVRKRLRCATPWSVG